MFHIKLKLCADDRTKEVAAIYSFQFKIVFRGDAFVV